MAVITTNDLTQWVLRDGADLIDATNIAVTVAAVNAAVIDFTGRSFDTDTTATGRRFRPLNGSTALVDDFHTKDGLVVKTDTTGNGTFDTTWATNDYELEPLNGQAHGQDWPYTKIHAVRTRWFPHHPRASVEVTAKWGWAAVPAAVKQGALIFAGAVYKRRDSPLGVVSAWDQAGNAMRISHKTDPHVAMMLQPYVRVSRTAMVR